MKDNISIKKWVSFASMYVTTLSVLACLYKKCDSISRSTSIQYNMENNIRSEYLSILFL